MFALKLHVARVSFKCFKCFRGMLQVFYTDIAKVDRDVAHVVMVIHVCCKLLFSRFHLFFSDECCKCVYLDIAYVFTHMMQMFYLDVAYVYNGFKCFCKCFRHMFQMFYLFSDICYRLLHLDISKLDRGLHLPPRLSAVSPRYQAWEGGAVTTGAGGLHVLVGGRSRRDMGEQAWDARCNTPGVTACHNAFKRGMRIFFWCFVYC
jgi:hypothetical protein